MRFTIILLKLIFILFALLAILLLGTKVYHANCNNNENIELIIDTYNYQIQGIIKSVGYANYGKPQKHLYIGLQRENNRKYALTEEIKNSINDKSYIQIDNIRIGDSIIKMENSNDIYLYRNDKLISNWKTKPPDNYGLSK